tara:strand:+ start:4 stop:561 length:558 start_codon:yes stop_codon:yes gene_type:complete
MTNSNKDKDSNQEEIDALKAEIEKLKAKEGTNNPKGNKIFCSNCNAEVKPGSKFCSKCGTVIDQNISTNAILSNDRLARSSKVNNSTITQPSQYSDPSWDEIKSKKTKTGIFAIFLGELGVHKFMLGYNTEGFILLGVSLIGGVITCGFALFVTAIIAVVEGIIILNKTPEEFKRLYLDKKTGWF